jgi:hypothetical protein
LRGGERAEKGRMWCVSVPECWLICVMSEVLSTSDGGGACSPSMRLPMRATGVHHSCPPSSYANPKCTGSPSFHFASCPCRRPKAKCVAGAAGCFAVICLSPLA